MDYLLHKDHIDDIIAKLTLQKDNLKRQLYLAQRYEQFYADKIGADLDRYGKMSDSTRNYGIKVYRVMNSICAKINTINKQIDEVSWEKVLSKTTKTVVLEIAEQLGLQIKIKSNGKLFWQSRKSLYS